MIKVFSGDKIIYLIQDKTLFVAEVSSVLAEVGSADEMRLVYDELVNKNSLKNIWFCYKDVNHLLEMFSSMFKLVEAAGGYVINKTQQRLFIFRNGKWDLPKGKVEAGESVEMAAVREVEEECGISGLRILRKLKPTYHIYELKGKQVLKPTWWFEMTTSDTKELVPQIEEGITEVKWIDTDKIQKEISVNTYGSILEVISQVP